MGSIQCYSLGGYTQPSNPWLVNHIITNYTVTFLIDSGADTNVLSNNTFKKLAVPSDIISKSLCTLSTFTGQAIPIIGQCSFDCQLNGQVHKISFYITNIDCKNILGRETSQMLKLLKRVHSVSFDSIENKSSSEQLISQYQDCFNGLGCIKNFQCHLTIKPEVIPSVDACRKIPFQLQDKVKSELNNLEKSGIIQKVDEPTDWVNSMINNSFKEKW